MRPSKKTFDLELNSVLVYLGSGYPYPYRYIKIEHESYIELIHQNVSLHQCVSLNLVNIRLIIFFVFV